MDTCPAGCCCCSQQHPRTRNVQHTSTQPPHLSLLLLRSLLLDLSAQNTQAGHGEACAGAAPCCDCAACAARMPGLLVHGCCRHCCNAHTAVPTCACPWTYPAAACHGSCSCCACVLLPRLPGRHHHHLSCHCLLSLPAPLPRPCPCRSPCRPAAAAAPAARQGCLHGPESLNVHQHHPPLHHLHGQSLPAGAELRYAAADSGIRPSGGSLRLCAPAAWIQMHHQQEAALFEFIETLTCSLSLSYPSLSSETASAAGDPPSLMTRLSQAFW